MRESLTQRLETHDRVSNQFGMNRFQTATEDWYPSSSGNADKAKAFQEAAARGRARARRSTNAVER